MKGERGRYSEREKAAGGGGEREREVSKGGNEINLDLRCGDSYI